MADGAERVIEAALGHRAGQGGFERHPAIVDSLPDLARQRRAHHPRVGARRLDRAHHVGGVGLVAQKEIDDAGRVVILVGLAIGAVDPGGGQDRLPFIGAAV